MKLESVTYRPTKYPKSIRVERFSYDRVNLRVDALDLEFRADAMDLVDLLHQVADAAIKAAAETDALISVRDVKDQLELITRSLGDAR